MCRRKSEKVDHFWTTLNVDPNFPFVSVQQFCTLWHTIYMHRHFQLLFWISKHSSNFQTFCCRCRCRCKCNFNKYLCKNWKLFPSLSVIASANSIQFSFALYSLSPVRCILTRFICAIRSDIIIITSCSCGKCKQLKGRFISEKLQ